MTARRLPLFCDTALARRIERVDAQLMAGAVEAAHQRQQHSRGFVTPIGGGVACFAEPGSPFNKVAGVGFAGVPTDAALDEVEQAFAARGADVQFEVSHLADPAVIALLGERGYRLASFENVLGCAIERDQVPAPPPGVEVRPSGEDEFDAWFEVVADGVAHPDGQGVPSPEDFPRDVLERAERDLATAGVTLYVALLDGVVAGGAGLRVAEGIAQLAGAATAPAFRRRGVHGALLAARLADAATAGCDVAVITTQPGSTAQMNVQHRGFDLLYTRAVLVAEL